MNFNNYHSLFVEININLIILKYSKLYIYNNNKEGKDLEGGKIMPPKNITKHGVRVLCESLRNEKVSIILQIYKIK